MTGACNIPHIYDSSYENVYEIWLCRALGIVGALNAMRRRTAWLSSAHGLAHSPLPIQIMTPMIPSQAIDVPHNMTTTGFELPGYRIMISLGVVRGVVVRSRSVFGTIGAGFQTLMGGNITLFTELAERTRQQAFDTMLHQAHMANANAVIGIRYDANELMKGVTEVLCYGTAVVVRPIEAG